MRDIVEPLVALPFGAAVRVDRVDVDDAACVDRLRVCEALVWRQLRHHESSARGARNQGRGAAGRGTWRHRRQPGVDLLSRAIEVRRGLVVVGHVELALALLVPPVLSVLDHREGLALKRLADLRPHRLRRDLHGVCVFVLLLDGVEVRVMDDVHLRPGQAVGLAEALHRAVHIGVDRLHVRVAQHLRDLRVEVAPRIGCVVPTYGGLDVAKPSLFTVRKNGGEVRALEGRLGCVRTRIAAMDVPNLMFDLGARCL